MAQIVAPVVLLTGAPCAYIGWQRFMPTVAVTVESKAQGVHQADEEATEVSIRVGNVGVGPMLVQSFDGSLFWRASAVMGFRAPSRLAELRGHLGLYLVQVVLAHSAAHPRSARRALP